MFSGIVEETATVILFELGSRRLRIKSGLDHSATKLGDSILIDGVCLTVVNQKLSGPPGAELTFDLAEETIRRSTLGQLVAGGQVNLERSLQIGERLHGHFVFGHVDAVGQLVNREKDGQNDRLTISYPPALAGLIAEKGSISISGVSLTVGEVTEKTFNVYIIPHTNSVTKISKIAIGEKLNLEADMLARYTRSILLANRQTEPKGTITEEFLREHGFK